MLPRYAWGYDDYPFPFDSVDHGYLVFVDKDSNRLVAPLVPIGPGILIRGEVLIDDLGRVGSGSDCLLDDASDDVASSNVSFSR